MNEQLWWHVARASGLVAWLLAIASILWGLALSTRALGKQPRAPWLLDLHRFLGGATIVLTLVHVGALIADSYVTFGLADVVVPWASEWRPTAVAWGVIAFWLLVAIQLTSLFMKRVPKKLWRGVHLTSYAVAILATVHGLAAGADARHPAVVLAWPVASAAIIFFTAYRAFGPGRRGDAPAARTEPATPANDRRAAIEAAKQRAAAAKVEPATAPSAVSERPAAVDRHAAIAAAKERAAATRAAPAARTDPATPANDRRAAIEAAKQRAAAAKA